MTDQHFELRSCTVCKGTHFTPFFDGAMRLCRCNNCGYVTHDYEVSAAPSPDQTTGSHVDDFLSSGNTWVYPHRWRGFKDVARRVARISPGARLLDVGCGDGHFIHYCLKRGIIAGGIECHDGLAHHAASVTGADVQSGEYGLDSYPTESFDVITFIHSLEHFSNPFVALKTAYHHLRPGGIVVIEVPSIRSPHWIAWHLTGIKKFVDNRYGVIPEHVSYFTPGSLCHLAETVGFDRLRLVTGRWRYRHSGALFLLGLLLDPIWYLLHIGGILYTGVKVPGRNV
jgi:SAM-dependent methyltransferase